jgi:hypothetical protein
MDLSNLIRITPVWKSVETEDEDFNIVIAHRGPAMGLWMTVQSCEHELADSPFKYSYIIVVNGEDTIPETLRQMFSVIQSTKKLRDVIHHVEPLAPPCARQLGTEVAVGKYLFFFDNHCLVKRGYFERAISMMETLNADMLHSTTQYYIGSGFAYHYPLQLQKNFWAGDHADIPCDPSAPYKIAMGGHGGFVVRRSTFEEVGGYGPLLMFEGWAGEEPYFDLKMAMMGKSNYLDPKLIHYHYGDVRGYDRHNSPAYYRNLMLSAYLIGGDAWLSKVYDEFARNHQQLSELSALRDIAVQHGIKHRLWLEQRFIRTLDQQLQYFKDNDIAH